MIYFDPNTGKITFGDPIYGDPGNHNVGFPVKGNPIGWGHTHPFDGPDDVPNRPSDKDLATCDNLNIPGIVMTANGAFLFGPGTGGPTQSDQHPRPVWVGNSKP